MNTYLVDFLNYFFPDIGAAPEWLQVFVGTVLLVLFLKLILCIFNR